MVRGGGFRSSSNAITTLSTGASGKIVVQLFPIEHEPEIVAVEVYPTTAEAELVLATGVPLTPIAPGGAALDVITGPEN